MSPALSPDWQCLHHIRIVLVEPAGPLNIGSIARVMKNMGLRQLVLVSPHCDHLGIEARQMAVHAPDILEQAEIVATVPEALRGCQRAIATTGIPRTLVTHLEHPRAALPWLLGDPTQPDRGSALIFGPEDRGLNNEELNYAQRFIHIPTHPDYPSMNLAQAVCACCYELALLTQPVADNLQPAVAAISSATSPPPAPLDLLEGYYQHLESVLLTIGYLHPHTAASRMEKFRRIFSRALPSTQEVAMLRGILSQMEWALKQRGQDAE